MIAFELGLSQRTVENRGAAIMRKLGVRSPSALARMARRRDGPDLFARAFLAWCGAQVGLGAFDLAGKLLGFGDLLLTFRTASYVLLTDIGEAGFWRVVRGFSEASGYANYALPCLAFAYVYWRESGVRMALAQWLAQLALLGVSTSSTA